MGQQKDQNPGQQSGGSGGREEQPQRRDQTNPGQPGGDRNREQKGGQDDREKRRDQARPGERQNPDRSDQSGRTGEQSGSKK